MRACSVEIRAARSWSSQKPGSPISFSSSARRALSVSGSKVITDPGELGPDLLELLLQRLCGLAHAPGRVAGGDEGAAARCTFDLLLTRLRHSMRRRLPGRAAGGRERL